MQSIFDSFDELSGKREFLKSEKIAHTMFNTFPATAIAEKYNILKFQVKHQENIPWSSSGSMFVQGGEDQLFREYK